MDIKSVLDERVIDLNMTAKNKKEAIKHLAGYLFERITGTDRNWTLCGNSSWEK